MNNAIIVDGVVKKFKTYESYSGAAGALFGRKKKIKTALDGVSFKVKRGEILAMLGRNGSGKSTLIKMLAGVLRADGGAMTVLGLDPFKDRIRLAQQIGVVFGSTHPQLFWDLPPIDTFNYIKGMYGISESAFERKLERFIDMLSLKDVYKRQTRQLSLGERMKCEFVCSNLHSPKLVLMDEPTVGVDLPSRMAIGDAVIELRKEQKTTFVITTHVVDDIANVDRIVMLDHGKLVFDGSQEEMRSMFKKSVMVELYFSDKRRIGRYAKYGKVVVSRDDYVKLEMGPEEIKRRWFTQMLNDDAVVDYRINEPSLGFMLNQMYKKIDRDGVKDGAENG
jgi:ABC-2 type transport system ATP-binding protein